ncbi:MAG: zinc-ribbon domain-containing protein [Clostridia bacterium]|nr:zinc-ribbon domain-containing protein [Clostridia bacterium]MBR5767192.1 zinc-ribbon domain-containing protein [Clostridia bacterium]
MKFCSNCGNRLEDDALFCSNCGANFASKAAEEVKEAATEAAAEINETVVEKAEEVKEAAVKAEEKIEPAVKPAQPASQSQPIIPPPVIANEAPAEVVEDEKAKAKATKPLSLGIFILFDILLCIPVINFIMTLVLSFAPKNKNVRHFWQAKLVWLIIAVVLLLVSGIFALIFQEQISVFIKNAYDAIVASGIIPS